MLRKFTIVCLPFFLLSPSLAAAEKRPLTSADAIETTRIQANLDDDVIVSPDGRFYATMLITGDVARDGNWITILAGSLESIETASKPRTIARLFGRTLGDPENLAKSGLSVSVYNPLFWLDNERVAFFWEDEKGRVQAYAANARTGKMQALTHHPTHVSTLVLGVHRNGATLYAARPDRSDIDEQSRQIMHDGFVVNNTDLSSLVAGHVSGESVLSRLGNLEWFLKKPGEAPVKPDPSGRGQIPSHAFIARISPDGRLAVIDDFPREAPITWKKYTHALWGGAVAAVVDGREDEFVARQVKQLYLIDISTGVSRPLWNAPHFSGYYKNVAWSPDSKRLLIGPTVLPPDHADASGLAGTAFVEIDVNTGKFQRLPLELDKIAYDGLVWRSDSEVHITTNKGVRAFRKTAGQWEETAVETAASAAVRISVKTDLNAPPKLVAIESATGREKVILDPNPDLESTFKLGHVEQIEWVAKDGRAWRGHLYFPADYREDQKYPVVLQTHGVHSGFSLYGWGATNIGTGSGVYVAQLLAGRNIAVLQIDDLSIATTPENEEAGAYLAGYDAAVRLLIDKGIADSARVGIQGFSRTGWHVQYSLTHSEFVYAAALATDNLTGDYVENTVAQSGTTDAIYDGRPFGAAGLEMWLENAPSFSVERVQSPLLKMLQGTQAGTVFAAWEFVTRLRRLGKPAEFYFMPDIEHGSHNPQNPRQVAALQNRALDWWLFWLSDYEDPAPEKAEQYAGWRKLRAQRDEVLKQPRPPLLHWAATPKQPEVQ